MRDETLVRTAALQGRFAAVETSLQSGFMAPLHAHGSHEAVRVLEGSVTIFAGAELVVLSTGEAFVIPEGVAHTFRAEIAGTRVAFAAFAPSAGRYEDFLRVGPVAVGPTGVPAWSHDEDASAVTAIAEAAAATVLGPPGMLPGEAEIAAPAA